MYTLSGVGGVSRDNITYKVRSLITWIILAKYSRISRTEVYGAGLTFKRHRVNVSCLADCARTNLMSPYSNRISWFGEWCRIYSDKPIPWVIALVTMMPHTWRRWSCFIITFKIFFITSCFVLGIICYYCVKSVAGAVTEHNMCSVVPTL